MKKLIWILPLLLFAGEGDADLQKEILKLNQKIERLSERVDENEFESELNKIKWSGEFSNTLNYYSGTIDSEHFSNANKWDMQLKLNMNVKINEKTKFTGRLMMTKAWGNTEPLDISYLDSLQGRANGTSALFVERAYVDYYFSKKFIMTIGRQPSTDGPGMNLKYDTPRKATYPALLFNGAGDGIVFTYKFFNRYKNRLRFAYGKGYQWQDSQNGWVSVNPGIKDTDVYGLFFEGRIPCPKMGRNLFILSGVKTRHLVTNPYDDDNATANADLGEYTHYGLYFENMKAFHTRFNYFISLAVSKPSGNGRVGVADLNSDGVPDTEVELLKKDGYAYHIGGRYDYKKYKIGAEFNHGSKYWFSFSTNFNDPTNKLAIRGSAYDFYLIYNMDLFQYVRFGYMYMKNDYNYVGMYYAPNGEPDRVDEKIKLLYVTYDVKW